MVKKSTRLTGRLCENAQCDGELRDSIINFGENLPQEQLLASMKQASLADCVIVMGSSMTVSPACHLPSLSYLKNGKFIMINLQKNTL